MASDARITRVVRCNCEKIEFTVSGVDKLSVHCYCTNCQRATGSAFAHNQRFTEAEVHFVKGEDLVKQYADRNLDSGGVLFRHFCSNCGSPLFLKSPAVPDFIAIHEGSTTDRVKSQPLLELYPQEKYTWLGHVKGDYNGPPAFPWDPQS